MEIQYVNVKLYSETPEGPEFKEFIPIFHKWIQTKIFDELLVDVADYSHLPAGPGIILICHEANYSVEYGPENRFGLLYNTKVGREGTNQDRIYHALQQAAKAAIRLQEHEFSDRKLRISGEEVQLTVNSRNFAPNKETTLNALRSDFESVFDNYCGASNYRLDRIGTDQRERFTLQVKSSKPINLNRLLELNQDLIESTN